MPIPRPIHFLTEFLTTVFIETGSHQGDAIQAALDAGFESIFSADISPMSYGYCLHRFRHHGTKVDLTLGDSRDFLRKLLPKVTTRSTFWLDAHWCGTDGGSVGDVPLLTELRIIKSHDLNNHHILIDDVRLFGTDGYPTLNQVKAVLKVINKDYVIEFRDSRDFPNDILIAKV